VRRVYGRGRGGRGRGQRRRLSGGFGKAKFELVATAVAHNALVLDEVVRVRHRQLRPLHAPNAEHRAITSHRFNFFTNATAPTPHCKEHIRTTQVKERPLQFLAIGVACEAEQVPCHERVNALLRLEHHFAHFQRLGPQ